MKCILDLRLLDVIWVIVFVFVFNCFIVRLSIREY